MSYAIEWTSGARRAFSPIDIEVQEAVLDELERFADAGDALPGRQLAVAIDHDMRIDTVAGAHHLFMKLEYDPPRRTLVLVRLGPHLRPAGR